MSSPLPASEIETLTAFACRLADVAAEVTLKYFKSPISVTDKAAGAVFDPVTAADRGAEEAIRAVIESEYPDHAIFGEEFPRKVTDSRFEWILDPVDGTRAFISGLPTWGTLIALMYDGEPLIGVIDQPYIKERYLGWPGGASLNGAPIHTRACPNLDKATVSTTDPALFSAEERPLFDALLGKTQLVRYGLDCYAYAVLSAGHMDIVVEAGLKPYDMAALIPVVRGAGGVATDWDGREMGECPRGRLLAVGDPALYDAVREILG
ncbi:histidinol-phosphatase [Kordiimonas marina]|uniref:histidinol-phosphatase n=1 Tax=Kordiimonas marina TaxID=2872312 RepID=UPI001FF573D6|nr:histidinol-phosphatase [Kordiimonas marina]